MLTRLALAACAALTLIMPARPALAWDASDMISAELRPGWRLADGDHVAALHIRLSPGWKTYWRAPGDAGIPPLFDWAGSVNVAGVAVIWPTPIVFHQSGMRSVGYADELVLPLRIDPAEASGDIRLAGEMQIGLCKDVCLPHTLTFDAGLPAGNAVPDPVIAAALASRPLSAAEASVGRVRCEVGPDPRGLRLRAEIDMASAGATEETVIEARDPQIWVAEPQTRREGGTLIAETRLVHVDGGAFALDRSGLRFTVLGSRHAVDIQGCSG